MSISPPQLDVAGAAHCRTVTAHKPTDPHSAQLFRFTVGNSNVHRAQTEQLGSNCAVHWCCYAFVVWTHGAQVILFIVFVGVCSQQKCGAAQSNLIRQYLTSVPMLTTCMLILCLFYSSFKAPSYTRVIHIMDIFSLKTKPVHVGLLSGSFTHTHTFSFLNSHITVHVTVCSDHLVTKQLFRSFFFLFPSRHNHTSCVGCTAAFWTTNMKLKVHRT